MKKGKQVWIKKIKNNCYGKKFGNFVFNKFESIKNTVSKKIKLKKNKRFKRLANFISEPAKSILIGLIAAGLFSSFLYAFATPPDSKYSPGDTLTPSCTPGSTNCSVTAPITGNQTITLSGDVTGSGTTAITASISDSWTGSTGITTLGTILTGGWNGTAIGVGYGGTGQNFSLTSQGSVLYFSATGTIAALGPGTAGHVLTSGGTGANPSWSAVSSSPGGSDTQVQFNNSSSFGGGANFTYNATTDALTVSGLTIDAGSITDATGTISFVDENLTTTGTGTLGGLVVDSNTVNLSDTTDEYVLAFDT
ncbi:hypothetical protein KKC00_01470, partial [Patescibacteria group bacterium]|nr:hypothetical protein [Patescibacteria group bacterium]